MDKLWRKSVIILALSSGVVSLFAQTTLFPRESEIIEERLAPYYGYLEENDELEKTSFEGEDFIYAILSPANLPVSDYLSRKVVSAKGFAFAFPDSDIAVVLDRVPEEFREIPAAHEYVEVNYQDHERATEFELEKARDENLLSKYMEWMREDFPGIASEKEEYL